MKSQKCIFIIPRVNTKILAQKSKLWIKMKYSKYSNNPKEVRKRIRDKKKKRYDIDKNNKMWTWTQPNQ